MKTLLCLFLFAGFNSCVLTTGELWTCQASSAVFKMCSTTRTARRYEVAADFAIEDCEMRCLTSCILDACY